VWLLVSWLGCLHCYWLWVLNRGCCSTLCLVGGLQGCFIFGVVFCGGRWHGEVVYYMVWFWCYLSPFCIFSNDDGRLGDPNCSLLLGWGLKETLGLRGGKSRHVQDQLTSVLSWPNEIHTGNRE